MESQTETYSKPLPWLCYETGQFDTNQQQKRKERPDFEELHDLARHARHLVEVETVAIETMERMISQQNVNFELLRTEIDKKYQIQAGEYMAFQLQMMKSLKSRAQATLDRLNGEVTLVS